MMATHKGKSLKKTGGRLVKNPYVMLNTYVDSVRLKHFPAR